MRVAAMCVCSMVIACGGAQTQAQTQTQTQARAQTRDCPERYDDGNAERATAESVAVATKRVSELEELRLAIPAGCEPVWYAQYGRFAVQPAMDDEPVDPARDAFADAINAADHVVATCDGGCGVVALALAPDGTLVDWMRITQRPGNAH